MAIREIAERSNAPFVRARPPLQRHDILNLCVDCDVELTGLFSTDDKGVRQCLRCALREVAE